MSEKLKKLTGKNPRDFEPVAYSLINEPDTMLFQELVFQDDFLFDFIKQNVSRRLEKVCNQSNYINLLEFLKYYSPSYEEFIVSNLAKYADEDLTDKMLEIFETGSDDEKTYCAKFFSYIQDPLSLDLLRANSYSENHSLSANCASTLSVMGDKVSYELALKKLNSEDDFEILEAVKFLVSYGNKDAVAPIIKAMSNSPFADNIAVEIPYLIQMSELFNTDFETGLYVLNNIINGLGEVSSLSQIFDFQLYEVLESLLDNEKAAVVILNAYDKFNTLTENDEYLYDEQKDTKQEVLDIKNLLSNIDTKNLKVLSEKELKEDSKFVYTAIELTENKDLVRSLLKSSNQTLILKSLEILKNLGVMTEQDKQIALKNITNENIKNIINAI